MKKLLFIFICLMITVSIQANADTIYANSCSRADIQAAHDSASDGDIIMIPAGDSTWDFPYRVNISKAVSFRGAGSSQTILRKTSDAQFYGMFDGYFDPGTPGPTGVSFSGMKLIGEGSGTYNDHGIYLRNGYRDFRIYDCVFEGFGASGVHIDGRDGWAQNVRQPWGVIYNCTFTHCYKPGQGYGVSVTGDNTWEDPLVLGDNKAVFVEDCSFSGGRHTIASGQAGQYVFRYNTITSNRDAAYIDAHGNDLGGNRGTRSWEIYENTLSHPSDYYMAVGIRGGDGVIFNNTLTNFTGSNVIFLCNEIYPDCGPYPAPDQVRDAYIWGNTNNGNPVYAISGIPIIVENRDFFNYEKPGYTPYTYPHPLRQGDTHLNPVASFTRSPNQGIAPLLVSFDASGSSDSDGNITSYEWDFGDGNTGSGITTTHTYQNNGVYAAQLTVTDNDGLKDTASKNITVTTNSPPIAYFDASPKSGEAPLEVSFDASGSYDSDGSIASYKWDFGDGNTGSGKTTTHTYQNKGEYNAKLTVTDNDGLNDSVSQNISVTNNSPPVAAFTASPASGEAPLKVSFDASGSSDPDGTITSYTWDFGDGNTGSGKTTTHTYQNKGEYTAKLTVTDNDGAQDSKTKNITVTNKTAPTASFTASPTSGEAPLKVSFDASGSNDPDGNITSYKWDFGDGNIGSSKTTTHTYQNKGEYTAMLTVTDNDGLKGSSTKNITVTNNSPPVASFTASPTSGKAPLKVSFDASGSSDPDGSITSYKWDFGDGNTGSGKTTTHTYQNKGEYTAKLTVTDNDGLEDSKSKNIEVTNVTPPVASFKASPLSGKPPLKVSFDASDSHDPDGNITSYNWNYGDGDIGSGKTTTHTYKKKGVYIAKLTVTDNDKKKNSSTKKIKVASGSPPVASFTASPKSGEAPLTVNFDATASSDPDGSISSYTWDFGDGANGTGIKVSHVYKKKGTYNATLYVKDDDGLEASTSQRIKVKKASTSKPVANFSVKPKKGEAPLKVNFDASPSKPSKKGGTIISYKWEFGDGKTAKGKKVRHKYKKAGTYVVTLKVTDNKSLTDSTTKEILVFSGPKAAFSFSPKKGAAPLKVKFNGSASQDEDGKIVSYKWDFGDGKKGKGKKVTHTYRQVGNFKVTLTVTDKDGYSNSTSKIIEVVGKNPYPPINIKITRSINRSLAIYHYIYRIEWEKNPENEGKFNIVKYRIYRKQTTEDYSAYTLIQEVDNQTFMYEDTSLSSKENNNIYTYAVSAVDENNKESNLGEPTSFVGLTN